MGFPLNILHNMGDNKTAAKDFDGPLFPFSCNLYYQGFRNMVTLAVYFVAWNSK